MGQAGSKRLELRIGEQMRSALGRKDDSILIHSVLPCRLRCCFFTPVGSEFFSTALLINRSLVHLDLGGNRLEDSGIKLLCHVLQQPTCTLEELE